MKMNKFIPFLLVLVICLSSIGISSVVVKADDQEEAVSSLRATGRFNMDVPAGKIVKANSSFPLEAGETVTIKATYTPFTASVDFGLIAPDGYFHYINVNDGSIDETIKVEERGNYTFAVQNNSSDTINVSGYVNY